MHVYLDLDCLTKLMAFGLLDETMGMLHFTHGDVHVCKTFRHTCESKRKKAEKTGDEAMTAIYQTAISWLGECVEIGPVSPSRLDALLSVDIDDGEATLLAAAAEDPELSVFLMTGDKRFIKAAGFLDAPQDSFLRKCKGRVIHLNHILRWLCDNMPFDELNSRMQNTVAQRSDALIKMAFTPGTTKERALEYLTAFSAEPNFFRSPDRLADVLALIAPCL